MTIYLPIAELPIDIFLLLFLGSLGGILAGMFGIGGGFLLTPLLIFIGIPPAVAVATSSNQIIASSLSGFMIHWYRRNVDIKMGLYLMGGGIVGAGLGVMIFKLLQNVGQIDIIISIVYVVFLATIGTMMLSESIGTIRGAKPKKAKTGSKYRLFRRKPLPFKIYFPRSDITVSLLYPIMIGLFAGMLVSIMGIGGGFLMIPAMIYLLGMPTSVVIGTSLFQIIFVTSAVTIMHAATTGSVDILLAFILIIGGAVGAQIGGRIGSKIPAEKLRILLALIVLAVCIKLGLDLFVTPDDLYVVEEL